MVELQKFLIEQMDYLVRDFANKNDLSLIKRGDYKEFVSWTLSCGNYKLEFVFTIRKKYFLPVHTLYVRLFLNSRFPDYFHIAEIMDEIEPDNYRSYYYPFIESIETLKACFEDLSGFLCDHFECFKNIANDTEKVDFLVERKREDMIRNLSLLESEKELMRKRGNYSREDAEHILENYMFYEKIELVDRFTGEENPYCLFLNGKREKAIKAILKSNKKNKCFSFENRLLKYLETKPNVSRSDLIPKKVDTLAKAACYKNQDGRETFICFVLQYLVYVLILLAINLGFKFGYTSLGAITVLTPALWTVILFAILPAMFGCYALKDWIIKLLRIKHDNAYDGFFDGHKTKVFGRIIFTIAGTLTALLYIGLCLGATRLHKDKMIIPKDLNDLVPISFVEKNYSDIEKVYYVEGRYNEDGDYINRASYILKFSDGYIYDFDRDTSVSFTEEEILPIFELYYDNIVTVKSGKDIK